MENINSTAMMDDWRNYLRNANTDIFEIIKNAIIVAASDHPVEFQAKRDNIAEMMFSSSRETLDETKKVPKVLKIKLIRHPETEDETNITDSNSNVTTENKVNSEGSTKVYRQGVSEVLRIKEILEKSGTHESVICDYLTKLQDMGLSIDTLDTTGVGKTVRALEKYGSKDVSQIARKLIKRWKAMVNEYWINKESSTLKPVSEIGKPMNSNSERKSKVNLEKANHSKDPITPKQQSKEELIVQHKLEATNRKQRVIEKEMLQYQKRLKRHVTELVKKQSSVVKSNEPPAACIESELHNPTKSTFSKKSEEQKLEATKRKLREGYERADNKKRQRQTQVIEMHHLLSKGLAPKYQDSKFGKSSFSKVAGVVR